MEKEQAEKVREKILEQIEKLPAEQSDSLRKEVLAMNEEELEQFLAQQSSNTASKQCLFCEIAKGAIESQKVYESRNILAVLDINPASPGHLLVMPKEHYTFSFQIPNQVSDELSYFVKLCSHSLLQETKAEGLIMFSSEGYAQPIHHFFINLIPRQKENPVTISLPRQKAGKEDLEAIGKKLKASLAKQFSKTAPNNAPNAPEQQIQPSAAQPSAEQSSQQQEKKKRKEPRVKISTFRIP